MKNSRTNDFFQKKPLRKCAFSKTQDKWFFHKNHLGKVHFEKLKDKWFFSKKPLRKCAFWKTQGQMIFSKKQLRKCAFWKRSKSTIFKIMMIFSKNNIFSTFYQKLIFQRLFRVNTYLNLLFHPSKRSFLMWLWISFNCDNSLTLYIRSFCSGS